MTGNEYQKLAVRTANKNLNFAEQLQDGCLGLTGEAGEAADMVKKALYHGAPLDIEKLVKELGDVMWYIAFLSDALGCPLEEVMSINIEKLKTRYPEGFSAEASAARVDVTDK